MPGYEDTHWAATQKEITDLKSKLEGMSAEDRPVELMTEIVVQLMRLNSHIEELHSAVHRVADGA